MSTTEILVQAEPRVVGAKSAMTQLREDGKIPAVLYGDGKPAEALALPEHAFNMMLKHHHGENLMMDIQIGDGAPRHVLLKQVQHHPITARILHVDFHEVSMTRKIKVNLPLNLTGIPAGVSKTGGTLDIQLRELEVECMAADMIEELDVDISEMKIGDHLTADDVTLPQGYRLITPAHVSIATVLKPRVLTDEEVAEDAAAAAPAEPEKIGGKKDDEEADED